MHFKFLRKNDMKAIDDLVESYGGSKSINDSINEKRVYETRKKIAAEKGFGEMLDKAERYVKEFPKVEDFITKENQIGRAHV